MSQAIPFYQHDLGQAALLLPQMQRLKRKLERRHVLARLYEEQSDCFRP